ncbi:Ig-like domain-containing protein [Halomonas denitrificans]|nr:tandem-95 repeat protein [Halomonas denitrificans]
MRRHPLLFALVGAIVVSFAAPSGVAHAQQSVNVSGSDGSARVDYTGDDWRLGLGMSDEGDVVAELLGVLAMGERDAWLAEGWFQDKAGGLKLNYHWLPGDGDPAMQDDLPGVWKLYVAADQNRWDDRKLSLGVGHEKENVFWSTQFSFGLTDERRVDDFSQLFEEFVTGTDPDGRPFRQLQTTNVLTETFEQAYDYGVGARVGRFFDAPNLRLQGGLDYEWGDFDSDQVTLSGTAEKFFTGTGHSLALSVEHYEKSGDFEIDDSDTRATLIWRYAFGRSYRPRTPAGAGAVAAAATVEAPVRNAPPETTTRVVRSNVDMEADAFFPLDSDDVREDSRARLQSVADLITSGPILGRVSVVGHTCDLGPAAYNMGLSMRRAEAVKRELVALGVDPEAIVIDGRGETEPLVPNTSEDNREMNRRVDVRFVRVVETEETVVVDPEPVEIAEAVVVREQEVQEVPAWVLRALRNPAQHKRTVDVYRFERTSTTVSLGDREFLNRAPVAENDVAVAARNGEGVFIDVLANDDDPDGDALSITSVTQPASGSVVNSGEFLTYTPAEGFQGEDSFTYTVSDGTDTATATVTVSVANDAPVAQSDSAETVSGVPVLIDVLANDSDPNGDELELVSVSSASGGTTSIVGDSVRYASDAGFTGTDSFTYTVRDAGGAEVTGEVSVTVTPATPNTPPVASDDFVLTDRNSVVVIDVLANDSDPDGDPLSIVELLDLPGADVGTFTVTEDNRVRFEPTNWSGAPLQVRYRISDGRGGFAEAIIDIKC